MLTLCLMMETCIQQCPIEQSVRFGPDVVKITFRSAELSGTSRPGQFVMVKTTSDPAAVDPILRRPFSIHDIEQDSVSLLLKVVGRGTKLLAKAKPGGYLDVLGPLGRPFPEVEGPLLLIGGGLGLAPLQFLTRERSLRQDVKIRLGAASKDDLTAAANLAAMAETFLFTEDGSLGRKGLVTAGLAAKLEESGATVMACGPEPMLRAVADICREAAAPCFVSLEARMACGVGACLGCVCETKNGDRPRVCLEGPVFRAETVFGGNR